MLIVTKQVWFPMLHQIFLEKKTAPSPPLVKFKYLRSLWIGLTAGVLNFPGAAIYILIASNNRILHLFMLTLMTAFGFPLLGVLGKLYSLDVSRENALILREAGL
jgi:hypothetical protein